VKETCIMCMQRQALPHNGGLCGTCAPPLRLHRFHRIKLSVRHVALS
jgi:hypothetical protein